jgi:hypothetical protein
MIADKTSSALGIITMSGSLITVSPGQAEPLSLISPAPAIETGISPKVDWSQELSGQPLWLIAEFVRQPVEIGGHLWSTVEETRQLIVVSPTGKLSSPDLRSFGKGTAVSREFLDASTSISEDEEQRYFVSQTKSFIDTPGVYFVHDLKWGRGLPPQICLPKSKELSQVNWPAGKYALVRVVVGKEAEKSPSDLPDDVRSLEFLGAIVLSGGPHESDKVVYPNENLARSSRRKRREVKTQVPPYEAVAKAYNDWRLEIPLRLVDLLTDSAPEPAAPTSEENSNDPESSPSDF